MLAVKPIELDAAVVAESIYGNLPHTVEPVALTLSTAIQTELQTFMTEFAAFTKISNVSEKCFRLDLYFDGTTVFVIEINVEIADGWGVSLNLLRAAGKSLSPMVVSLLPQVIPTFPGDLRSTEFDLARSEFQMYGQTAAVVVGASRVFDELDSKIYLARFAQVWKGSLVKVPKTYYADACPWEKVPKDVYLKFADKFCSEAIKARYSAKPRFELGRAKQMRKLYQAGQAIAQERIDSYRLADNRQVQAVVMCSGTTPVTGYIQIAGPERQVINDKDTAKGALVFS